MSQAFGRSAIRAGVPLSLMAITGLLVIVPLAMLVYTSFVDVTPFSGNREALWTIANYRALWSAKLARTIGDTVLVAFAGTVMAMMIGAGMAWLAARTDVPFKPLVHLSALMPLFVSLLVASIAWSLLGSGRSGYINIVLNALGVPWRLELQSLTGIAFLFGLYYAPYPFIFIYSALTLINPDLEEAAAVHGADMRRVAGKITFPLIRPALVGSTLLVFVLMIEDFPVPQILGSSVGIETLSIRIYTLMATAPAQPNQAAAVSVLLTVIACGLVFAQRWILGGRDYRTVTGKGAQVRVIALRRLRGVAIALVAFYVFVAVVLPLFALIQAAMRSNLFIPDAAALFDVSNLGFGNLVEALTDPKVRTGLMNSLTAGGLTAVVGVTLYFALAYTVNRTDLKGRQILEYLAMLPVALPALIMGLGILWTWVSIPLPVYGTLAILVVAFTTRFMPQGYRAIAASVSQIHDDLEQAAMVAGATRLRAIWYVTLPLLRGGVAAAAFITIVLSIRELTASLFLYTANTRVLSIVIYEKYLDGAWAAVASISLIYTLLLVILTLLGRRWMRAGI